MPWQSLSWCCSRLLFQIFFEIVVKQGAASETYSPQHDWAVSYKSGDFTYNGLSAVQKNNVVLQRGDSILVQNELPPGHPLVVRFLTYHKLIEIYQDDIMLYSTLKKGRWSEADTIISIRWFAIPTVPFALFL